VASHPAAGAGANIGISGVAALAAAIVHVRAGRINWRLFAWMAPPSMVGAVAGGYLSGVLPDTALLVTIGAVLVYFGIDLLRERERRPRSAPAGVIGHTPDGVDWDLLAIGSAASVPGALLGARLTGRLSERQLLRAIGAMLVVAGATTALQALV
jgi:uncharacterized membrane protein YfcA